MTALQQPPRADGPPQPPVRVPFPVVDEVARHCLQEEEPETVHIEVHLPGRLDAGRLSAAFAQALRRHPRILMREAPGRWYRRRYEWELTAEPDVAVVGFPAPGRDALRDARTRALTEGSRGARPRTPWVYSRAASAVRGHAPHRAPSSSSPSTTPPSTAPPAYASWPPPPSSTAARTTPPPHPPYGRRPTRPHLPRTPRPTGPAPPA